jgi:hypothetical protein
MRSANCLIPRRIRRIKTLPRSQTTINIGSRSARYISRLSVRVPKRHNVVHVLYKYGRNIREPRVPTRSARRTICDLEELSNPLPERTRKLLVAVAGRPLVWLLFSRDPLTVPRNCNGYHRFSKLSPLLKNPTR